MRTTRLLVLAAGMGWATVAAAQGAPAAETQTSYRSLEGLPELPGMWLPEIYPFIEDAPTGGQRPLPEELRPEAAEAARAQRQRLMSGEPIDRGYCTLPAFGGVMPMQVSGVFELLFSPGRVTIATEGGLVRRIYLGRTGPGPLDESRGGYSTGRWEGETLVVETTGLSPAASFRPGVPVGRGASVTERFSLDEEGKLVIRTTLTAPDLLTGPLSATNVYRRAPNRVFTELDMCSDGDRSFDGETLLERFDATPPDDLPPPPVD